MREKQIGSYRSYILEDEDLVVVMGEIDQHAELLKDSGFEQHEETGEWLGRGRHLYAMDPDTFFTLFSARDTGHPDLSAQATDGKDFYQVDALPIVVTEEGKDRIDELRALDLETRTFIDEGVSNFKVG
ncbi:TPA: hypothetical protein DCE37_13660 [Candidatus Latescibacteria bacterium]|nr:hypothetical protein [Candidatus Latescibacterota bacterium]|tara:strand:+ start:205 stop:591 length:387 start_codon:yes stop_codon:yes gene_type:complete